MANKSGKKLAPTKKEREQGAPTLLGRGASHLPVRLLIQKDSSSSRGPQLHHSPFLPAHSFSCGVRRTGKPHTASHQQRVRRDLWLEETSKVKMLAPEQNVLTDLREPFQCSMVMRARAGLDSA